MYLQRNPKNKTHLILSKDRYNTLKEKFLLNTLESFNQKSGKVQIATPVASFS